MVLGPSHLPPGARLFPQVFPRKPDSGCVSGSPKLRHQTYPFRGSGSCVESPPCSLGLGGGGPSRFSHCVPPGKNRCSHPSCFSFEPPSPPCFPLSCLLLLSLFPVWFSESSCRPSSCWHLDMQILAAVLHECLTLGRAARQDGCAVAAFNHREQLKP